MFKRGVAIPTALVLISVLMAFLFAMMNYSSQEMFSVKTTYEQKRAEYLAYSGLNWAESSLMKKRWWVNGGFDPTAKVPRATGGASVQEFFGPGNGKAYIIAEEFEAANPSPVKGYSVAQRLDHIRVFSIGEYKNQRVLVYGKFIMSPEPFLNSDSTEGADTQATASTEDGKALIEAPQPWSPDGPVPSVMVITELKAAVGDKVDPNSIIAVAAGHPDDPVKTALTWDIKAPVFGTLTRINFVVGQQITANDIFGECTDELMTSTRSNRTLKKMVRVTKIIDKAITQLDLTDFEVRRQKLDLFIKNLSEEYVVNYAKNLPYIGGLENSFNSPAIGDSISAEDVVRRLSSVPVTTNMSVQTAGNKFMDNMIEKWVLPGLSAAQKEKFPEMSEYHLAIGKSKPRAEIIEVLSHFGRLDEIVTRPQKFPELYKIPSTQKYKSVMNFGDSSKDQSQFVHDATYLPDAAKKIHIVFNNGIPLNDEAFQEKKKNGEINASDYWFWHSKNGWYTKPSISITSVEIPYNFVNKSPDTPFTMEVSYVLNYLRKHYDEGMAIPPGGKIRLPGDQKDAPQPPGPPDSSGSSYSGLSS